MSLTGAALTPVLQTVVIAMGTLSTFESLLMALQFLPRDRKNIQLISIVIPMTIAAFLTNAINLAYLFLLNEDCNHHYAGAVFYQMSYWLMDLLLMSNAYKLLKQTNKRYRHIVNGLVSALFIAVIVSGITEIVQKPMMIIPGMGICIPGFALLPWTIYGACELTITLILALFFLEELAMVVRAMRRSKVNKYTLLEVCIALSKDHIVLSLIAAFILFVTHTLIEHGTLGPNTFSLIFISQPMTVRLITYSVNPEFAPVHEVSRSGDNLSMTQKVTADKLGLSNGRLSHPTGNTSVKSLHAERQEFMENLEKKTGGSDGEDAEEGAVGKGQAGNNASAKKSSNVATEEDV